LRVDFGTPPSVEARIQGISFFLQAIIALIILSFRVLGFFGLIFDDKFSFIE